VQFVTDTQAAIIKPEADVGTTSLHTWSVVALGIDTVTGVPVPQGV